MVADNRSTKAYSTESESEHRDPVWIDCPHPVMCVGLTKILEKEARVHVGREAPEENPSCILLGTDGVEDLSEGIKRLQKANLDAPIVVSGLHLDLPLARAALRVGARGFIHAGMQPEQIIRALNVVAKGEIAAPRKLIEYLIANEQPAGLNTLSARQKEILELVSEGLSNAQIAKKLFLSEHTVKQHLRAAYRVLGVSNRTEAVRLIRGDA